MPDIQVNVMMFGGRRCGKTSILAAMQSCFREALLQSSNLIISTADDDTMFKLKEKNQEIKAYFSKERRKRFFTPDDNPDADMSEYKFKIALQNRSTDSIIVNFIDYPGEWLADKEKIKNINQIMEQSHIILVAIDSPHLMEETSSNEEDALGIYNDERNYCYQIGEQVINYFRAETTLSSRMILFVPLKCEKYYHKNQMDLLNRKVHVAYENALVFFGKNDNAYEVAITPILTFGGNNDGVEFSQFKRDDDGHILLNLDYNTPQKAIYKITRNNMYKPEPLHCEQPMVYVLAYVLKILSQRKRSVFDWIKETFLNFAATADFLRELDTIKRKMKKSGNGYEIVQNPLEF